MTEKDQYIQESFLTPKINGKEDPFQWGDELEPPKENTEIEVDSPSYISVAELLDVEEEVENKRLEEYLKKPPRVETSK